MCYYEQADSQATIQRGECGGGDGGGAPAPAYLECFISLVTGDN